MLFDIAFLAIGFIAGALVGHNNVKTVDKAISDLKVFEARAKITLQKITAHKET